MTHLSSDALVRVSSTCTRTREEWEAEKESEFKYQRPDESSLVVKLSNLSVEETRELENQRALAEVDRKETKERRSQRSVQYQS